MTEQDKPKPAETEVKPEVSLLSYAKELGFVETGEMVLEREAAITAGVAEREAAINIGKAEDETDFVSHYNIYMAQPETDDFRQKLARMIAGADLSHAAKMPARYREVLDEAIAFAAGNKFAAEADRLRELQLEVFEQDYITGLSEFEAEEDVVSPLDPFTLRADSVEFETMSSEEFQIARRAIFGRFKINPEEVTRTYDSKADESSTNPGIIHAKVYNSGLEGYENLFVHELQMPDGKPSWIIGPDEDI